MVNPLVSLNKQPDVDVPMSMLETRIPVPIGAPGNNTNQIMDIILPFLGLSIHWL